MTKSTSPVTPSSASRHFSIASQDAGSIRDTSFIRLPHSACIWPGVRDLEKATSCRVSNHNDSGIHNDAQNDNSNTLDLPANEVIPVRRFNGLQMNAANRVRSANFGDFNFGQDDSIIVGETTASDLTDGVELRTKRLEMYFRIVDAAALMFSMGSFLLDLVTDIAVAVFHYLNQDYWYCALTVAFIMLPTLVTTCMSLRWYMMDSKIEGTEPVSKSQWLVRVIFHVLQIGPVLRYYESLSYGLKFRKTEDPEEKRRIYMKMIYEDADATMLRLFESFMESAPQLILQMYILTKNYPFDDLEYWTTTVQTMSISSSLISISWSLVSYSKSLRISLPNKIPMTYWGIAVMFSWEFFSVTARMLALALFTSAFVQYVGLVCLVHWACMTFWIITMQTNFCSSRFEEFAFNAILGVIFIFCYFNPIDSSTRYRYLAFYLFMLIENTILMAAWFRASNYEPWLKELAVQVHYGCFLLGIVLMLIYYRYFHPTGAIRVYRQQCS